MQTRCALWIFAVLLLAAGAAVAAQTAPAVHSSASDAAFVASLACAAPPSATPRTPVLTFCGTCSLDIPCRNVVYGTSCTTQTVANGHCVHPLNSTKTCDDSIYCECLPLN